VSPSRLGLGAVCAIVVFGCRTTPVTQQREGYQLTNYEQRLVRADSEVFEAVVRAQLAGTEKTYPFHLDDPVFDSRPYGTDSARAPTGGFFKKDDLTFGLGLPAEVVSRLVQARKQVLASLNVREGPRRNNNQCPRLLVPRRSPDGAIDTASLRELRAKCPRKSESYLHVGIPIPGEPADLRKPRGLSDKPLPELDGELWTVIVEADHAGPGGSMWEYHAWVFRRNPATRRLELARTSLIGIAE